MGIGGNPKNCHVPLPKLGRGKVANNVTWGHVTLLAKGEAYQNSVKVGEEKFVFPLKSFILEFF